MYSNDYQTNAPTAFFGQTVAPQYEKNVSDAVSGPSLGIAHQQVDEALNRLYKTSGFLRETADRIFGAFPPEKGSNTAEPNAAGTLPGLLQKLSWLHAALTEIEVQSTRFGSL